MTKEIEMTWEDFESVIAILARAIKDSKLNVKNIYGVPRGGLVIAVRLSHLLQLPLTEFPDKEDSLLVDDVVDTGKTLEPDYHEGYRIASLYWYRKASFKPNFFALVKPENSWIVFPWEQK